MEILAGDIGGTNCRLALFQVANEGIETLIEASFVSANWASLTEIIHTFVSDHSLNPAYACFGIAGPIHGRQCKVTSLPWRVDADDLATTFGFKRVELINDLEANAWGINALSEDDFCLLNPGNPDLGGNRCIISAGTGLGEAGLYWDGHTLQPFASEGGHADFSPSNEVEFALFQWLGKQHRHVSWERVVSGPGLVDIHRFLCQFRRHEPHATLASSTDPAATISQLALQKNDPICEEALHLLVRCYAAEAGNHALKLMATGGVYIGGGIAPKIIERLTAPGFIETFCDKGRMSALMHSMPVRVILNPQTALFGPALSLYHQLAASH
ncbi:MAG: glucokinase [Candidatus Polarisedimenticolaceae bacterium]|nr:glucokinase [Candidatus Polarisedimenticolaceae bacterium]